MTANSDQRKFQDKGRLRHDLLASIVVFLVALPLCMGIAVASGVPVAAGLVTGIVGGLIVGGLAGAPLQVSGPAAGLTVLVYDIVQEFGLESLGLIVLLAGGIQLAAGTLRAGQWFRAVSPAVIRGMLSGIGILIFASQFHVMVDDRPRGTGLENLLSIPEAVVKGLPLPEWQTQAERAFEAALLKEIGAIHEQQVQIQERVAELASSEALGHSARTDRLAKLAATGAEISVRLAEAIETIESSGRSRAWSEREAEIHEVAVAARQATVRAVEDLRPAGVDSMRDSQASATAAVGQLLAELKNHDWAAKVGLLTILSIICWQTLVPRSFRVIPAALVAVITATVFSALLSLPILYVEVPDNLFSELHFPSLHVLRERGWLGMLLPAFAIALVASAETLLCATAVDQMHSGKRTNYDKELRAQGIGNMVCGFVGALPMTGVIVRSAANVQAGARSRMSAILHGVWLLIFVVALAFLLRMIPTACLAGMLVYIGYKLIDFKALRQLREYGWTEVGIFVATVVMIVVTDLLTGVITGVLLSAAKLLYRFSHLSTDLLKQPDGIRATLFLHGAATFLRLPRLAAALEQIPANAELHVDFEHLDYVDHACLDLLMNWAEQHEATGGTLVIDWDRLHARFRGEANSSAANPYPALLHTRDGYRLDRVVVRCDSGAKGICKIDVDGVIGRCEPPVVVLGIETADGRYLPPPSRDHVLSDGDTLVVYGEIESVRKLQRAASQAMGTRLGKDPSVYADS